jgi:DNA-directed RNA polymerase specialized sigma subunit
MTRKERDIELWKAYNQNPGRHTLKPLMKQIDPVIQVEVNKWSGAIARPVLEAKAKALALEAIKSYNPNAGAALATHVTNRLKKLSRKVYTHQDAVRLPEYKKLKVQSLHKANEALMGIHGREATNQELADHLAWSPKMLSGVQQSQHAELIQSEDMGAGMFQQQSVWGSDTDDGMVDMLYFDMEPTDKLIFEHSTGYSGKPILSNAELRAKTKLTQGQLSYRKRQMVNRISDNT